MLPTSMKAVVCKAPFEVVVEQRPVPKILDPRDAILKVLISGLCGGSYTALPESRLTRRERLASVSRPWDGVV